MRRIIKHALRHPRLTAYLRSVYHEGKAEGLGGNGPDTDIAEASPIASRPSTFTRQRLNLLVPALATESLFGGISTAITLFEALAQQTGMPDLRIILTDQQRFEHVQNPSFDDWKIRTLDEEDCPGRCVVAAGDRQARTLPVRPGDRFMATAWWTAVSARAIQNWQVANYKMLQPAKYLYLIQDYEPGFYPWSSRYALAEASYHDTDRFVAIFNTNLLKNFFLQQGYEFSQVHAFEPVLHPILRQQRELLQSVPKQPRLLVYGRPGVARNAFELTIMGLRAWVAQGGGAGWSFVSAGEQHPVVELGNGCQLLPLGKLSLEQYASELSHAAVGLSLMISPHPSYPPLEMVAFGLQVVSNRYGPKELGKLYPGILSADPLTPTTIAERLAEAAQNAFAVNRPSLAATAFSQHYLTGECGFGRLAELLLPQLD